MGHCFCLLNVNKLHCREELLSKTFKVIRHFGMTHICSIPTHPGKSGKPGRVMSNFPVIANYKEKVKVVLENITKVGTLTWLYVCNIPVPSQEGLTSIRPSVFIES